ncbi:hybrid sensor histidine kinase/response regulator [Thiovibrio sp. JS02]
MSFIGILDLVSLLAFALALFWACRLPRQRYGAAAKLLLCLFLACYVLAQLSNVLEYFAVTIYFDRYEDYLEVLVLPLFVFFVFSVETWRELRQRERMEKTLQRQADQLVAENRERRQAETDLRQEKERLEKITAMMGAGLAVISRDYKITWANRVIVDIFGDPVGKPCHLSFNREEQVCPDCGARQIFEDGKEYVQREICGVDRQGQKVWSEVIVTPIYDADGAVAAALEVLIPITERKKVQAEKEQLETQLRYSQKMEAVGTLAGGIAHDFNNLLYVILGNAEMTALKIPKESELQKNLAEILKACRRASELVNQILTFSRSSEKERLPLCLAPIVKESLKFLRETLPTTIEIREQIHSQCGQVLAEVGQIHQLLVNLCTNAAEAMRDRGGILTVRLEEVEARAAGGKEEQPGSLLKLTVADTGVGMSEGVVARMFEPYFTTKERGKGTGLGLATVHGIVEAHGGSIEVESNAGQGTRVMVSLPLLARAGGEAEGDLRAEGAAAAGQGEARPLVLVVDDEEAIVRFLTEMLDQAGYEVEGFADSRLAWETFVRKPDRYDLVITDQTMPGLTGLDLAKNILVLRADLPVILATGHSEEATRELAGNIGISHFLKKPVSLANLRAVVAKVLTPGEEASPEQAAAEDSAPR